MGLATDDIFVAALANSDDVIEAFEGRIYETAIPIPDTLLDLIDYFLFHVGEIFNYNLFKNFLIPFLFLFFFWNPII